MITLQMLFIGLHRPAGSSTMVLMQNPVYQGNPRGTEKSLSWRQHRTPLSGDHKRALIAEKPVNPDTIIDEIRNISDKYINFTRKAMCNALVSNKIRGSILENSHR
jgi:hypothetical protein